MRCAIYIRVSKDIEEQKTSLINQQLLFEQYAKQHNHKIVEIYTDVESGTKTKRPGLQQLMIDISKNKFDLILAKELSRLSRNGSLSYQLRDLITENKIDIITLDGAINTLEDCSDLFGLFTWLYERESQTISYRIKASKVSHMKNGYYIGSIPPYGYIAKNKKLYIRNDETVGIVNRIFSDYLGGLGFDKIAKDLTDEGIPTPSMIANKSNASFQWHGSTIRGILENRHYIGDLVQGKEATLSVTLQKRQTLDSTNQIVIEGTHAPIISYDMFHAVQQLIHSRKQIKPTVTTHLFSNLLFCLECGKRFHYRHAQKGYICGTYGKRGKHYCSSHFIKEAKLIQIVIEDLNSHLQQIDLNLSLKQTKTLINNHCKHLGSELKTTEKDILKLQKENQLALNKFIKGMITREEYSAFISLPSQNLDTYQKKAVLVRKIIETLKAPSTLREVDSVIHNNYISDLTPELLHTFISKIEISEHNRICIHYRFTLSINA